MKCKYCNYEILASTGLKNSEFCSTKCERLHRNSKTITQKVEPQVEQRETVGIDYLKNMFRTGFKDT
jgi:hypothetical protein